MSLGRFRSLSPPNATSVDSTQYGDHGRQVEMLPPTHVSPQLLQHPGGQGDAYHVSEDAVHEFKSPQSVSSASFVGRASDVGIPTSPAGNIFSSIDVELTGKTVQPQEESGSSTAVNSRSKQESDQTLSHVTTLSQTTRNVLPTSVSSTDKRLNWETLFMPYRRHIGAVQTSQHGNQAPVQLATLFEGFSVTSNIKQYSEGDIARTGCADNTSVDNTSVWVMSCEISVTHNNRYDTICSFSLFLVLSSAGVRDALGHNFPS